MTPFNTPLWILCLALLFAPLAHSASNVEQRLIHDIKQAKQRLSSTEKHISSERLKRVKQLNTLEREVLALRKKAEVAQRLADERTLGLSQLERRLDQWRQQQTYQHNLLTRYLRQQGESDGLTSSSLDEKMAQATQTSQKTRELFFPSWTSRDLILTNGNIEPLPTLSLGPVTWYWHEETQQAGLASVADIGLKASTIFNDKTVKDIASLFQQSRGIITFDPTLSRATAREQQNESPLEHISKGGLWAIPILLFALFALSIAVAKGIQLWRLPKTVSLSPLRIKALLSEASPTIPPSLRGMQRQLLEIALSDEATRVRDDHLFITLQEQRHRLERWVGAIAITASVAPLLGLLGTVSGMIETFNMMTLFGTGDPEVVSGGIAQALITTELGLVVAIPALILNAILSRRARSYYQQLENFAVVISQTVDTDDTPIAAQESSSADIKKEMRV